MVTTAANAGRDALNLTWDWLGKNFDALLAKLGGALALARVFRGNGALCASCHYSPAASKMIWITFADCCHRRFGCGQICGQRRNVFDCLP